MISGALSKTSYKNSKRKMNSSSHNTSEPGHDNEKHDVLINSCVIFFSAIAISCCAISLRIIARCQRLPLPIKYLSTNFLICLIMTELAISLHSVAMLIWGHMYYRLIFDLRIFFGCVFVLVLWCSLGSVTYERLLALIIPLRYVKYATRRRIAFVIFLIWTANVLIPIIIFTVSGIRFCNDLNQIYICDVFALFRPIKLVLACMMIIYASLIVLAYTKILAIIFHHQKITKEPALNQNYLSTIVKWQNNLRSTKTIAALIFAFIVLQSPIFFHLVVFEFRPDFKEQKWRVILQCVDYISNQLNMYASLYLYIWKFKECRMIFFSIFSKWNKDFQEKADTLRIEVFNIVTIEPSYSKVTHQSSV